MMLTLYSYFRSSASYRVRIALNYKNLSYQQKYINLRKEGGQQHTPQYKQVNPQGLVPTLLDGDQVIGQSMAILEYLEEKYPEPALLPSLFFDRAIVRSMAQLIASDIQPLNNLRVLNYLNDNLNVKEEEKIAWHHHWLRQGFTALETLVKKYGDKCCFKNDISYADIALIPQIHNAKRFHFDMEAYPKLLAINNYCLSLPAFDLAQPEKQQDAD